MGRRLGSHLSLSPSLGRPVTSLYLQTHLETKKNQHSGCLLVHISRFPFFFFFYRTGLLPLLHFFQAIKGGKGRAPMHKGEEYKEGGCPHLTSINTLSGFGRRGGREGGRVRPASNHPLSLYNGKWTIQKPAENI